MRESVQRQRGPWLSGASIRQRSTDAIKRAVASGRNLAGRGYVARTATVLVSAVLLGHTTLLAQQAPWERAASNLERTFTGPLARSLALVAIVIGGLMFMFGEGGAKRQISGIVFGGGLTLFAAQFLTWLF
jgi:type IV secretory pathway VirB2 component (pilin)